MKKVMLFVMCMTAASFADLSHENTMYLRRIADALEKIEKQLSKGCVTSSSSSDNSWKYNEKPVNHPYKATPTNDDDAGIEALQRCADKCNDLYSKYEDTLDKCLEDCIERY